VTGACAAKIEDAAFLRKQATASNGEIFEALSAVAVLVALFVVALGASAALPVIKGLPQTWWYAELSVPGNLFLLAAEGIAIAPMLCVTLGPVVYMCGGKPLRENK